MNLWKKIDETTFPHNTIFKEIDVALMAYRSATTNWQDHFDDMIGVTSKPEGPQKVTLLFTKSQANYIETKPMHGILKFKRGNDGT